MLKLVLALLLILSLCSVSADDEFDAKNTIALTEDNFEKAKGGTWMVMFWAPWCGHCRRVKPYFAEASALGREDVSLGTVDCTADNGKPLCDQLGVSSYPSFRYSIDGSEMMKYEGPRSTDDFVRFVDRLGNHSLHVLQFTSADIEELEKRDDVNVFVFCTEDGKPTEQVTWVSRRGLTYGRSYFGTIPSSTPVCGNRNTGFLINDVGKTEIAPSKGAVEECLEDEVDSVRLKSVLEWVAKHKHLAVDRIDQGTFHHMSVTDKPYLFMLVSKEGEWDDQRPFLNVLRKVVEKPYAETFAFGWLDGIAYGEWVADFIDLSSLPTVLVYHIGDESSFTSEEAKIAVHHAVAQGGDEDGAMQASVEDMIEGIATGRYELTFQGPAGHILGLSQKFFPLILPQLKELRRSAQSDVFFIGLVLIMVVLLVTVVVNFIQIALGGGVEPEPRFANPQGMTRAQQQMLREQLIREAANKKKE
eukprot:TRINITY_DN5732_c1_g1_i1.p1 TRINITY_DN5732_c1_g1~~TRINITY_DN5732_c1_g1_i1.p1  ORF type:complete len:501 (+),score=94.30 TRINITY_DN5732_c1_g1_i1:84-1505(+)